MKQITLKGDLGNVLYYKATYKNTTLLFSLKEFNDARNRAVYYKLELNDIKPWWKFW